MTQEPHPTFQTFDDLQAWAGAYARCFALSPAIDQLAALNHIRAVTLAHKDLMEMHR